VAGSYVLFSVAQAKSYFLSPAYPMLFAGGAIVFERILRGRRHWIRPVYVVLLLLSGLVFTPAALPVLPPATYSHVYGFLGGNAGAKEEQHTPGQLPQWLADRPSGTMTEVARQAAHAFYCRYRVIHRQMQLRYMGGMTRPGNHPATNSPPPPR
jgi:hypothetical protein